jgi:DNA invertase Pin-like site-specific DNA recombinase
VLGLECSRLARNPADWHQLLGLCGMTGTLICDEDGLYDPRNFNDRLLLGMKGQLSEAELHFIRARLRGGIISKARRGELITPLPVGLAYDAAGHVVLDPDTAVRGAVAHLFATFAATGSATACVKAFSTAASTSTATTSPGSTTTAACTNCSPGSKPSVPPPSKPTPAGNASQPRQTWAAPA